MDTLFSGEYRSVFKGRGLEFSEVREYQVGDDVRTIEWNVTARRGHPYVKRFVEERDLNVILIVDLSASKEFGTGEKSHYQVAVEIAAILALSAVRSNDRVGLLLVTDRVEFFLPPASGRRHALRILLELLTFQPVGRRTDLSVGLSYVAGTFHHRSVVFLLSDFIFPGAEQYRFRGLVQKIARWHDLIPVRLFDSRGEVLPDVGWMHLRDPETGGRAVVDTGNAQVRDAFRRAVQSQRAAMTKLFSSMGVELVDVETKADDVAPLIAFFRRRERVMT